MRVAIAGAGVAGLTAAYRLSQAGHACDVYERWPGLGGQAATLDVGGGARLERYYHHLFTSDRHIAALFDELGLGDELEWRPSSVGFFADGRLWPFTGPLDLLRFGPLSPVSRVRMGAAVLWLQRRATDVAPFERETAQAWIERAMGRQAWAKVWGPLLRGKFGDRAEDISMAWLWSKLTLRRQIRGEEAITELLGYPRRSWEPFLERLSERIEAAGGRVFVDRPMRAVARDGGRFVVSPGAPGSYRTGHDPRSFPPLAGLPAPAAETDVAADTYDAVVATVPNQVFLALLDDELAACVGPAYSERLRSVEYHTALCLLLELDRPFGRFYWTNIADRRLPFVGLIEHTNLVGPERYGGRRFLYVANYLAAGDELLTLDADALLARYLPGLRMVQPGFDPSWVRARWLHREPAAQPIVTVGYRERIPPLSTGVPGLILANTTQIYPEDRGTNYAVRLGGDAAAALLAEHDLAPARRVASPE